MQNKQNIHETDGGFVTNALPVRVTPGSIAAKMAARRRELIARPLAEIWEDLAKVAAAAITGWQPIETAPKDGTEVLLFTVQEIDDFCDEAFTAVQIGHWDFGNDRGDRVWHRPAGWHQTKIGDPTHWMPLPPAPEAQS